jgi:enoyl-CoA hydratase/carnithine racemase
LSYESRTLIGSEEVRFADVVGTRLDMRGMEYFGHPWEFGPRRAKELMLSGDPIYIEKAYRLSELADQTPAFARRIAQVPTVIALLIKKSVNQTVDKMGFHKALQSCFTLCQPNHSHGAQARDDTIATTGKDQCVPNWRTAPPVALSVKDRARADS